LPLALVTRWCNRWLNAFASGWIGTNTLITRYTKNIEWQVSLPPGLSRDDWYLVVANHQTWVDILALQQTFNGKIPFLKFFLKQQLFWVPVLGIAWWALDFPFMQRYSKSYLKKYPHKKGKDFETTRKACEKFKSIPISIMNFAEGTRFTTAKHQQQGSPYSRLLKPKAGGIGYVLTLMPEIKHLLDVTICYPDQQAFNFWDYMCGRVSKVHIEAKLIEIPADVRGNYIDNAETRRELQQWLNQLWQQKDERLAQLSAVE